MISFCAVVGCQLFWLLALRDFCLTQGRRLIGATSQESEHQVI